MSADFSFSKITESSPVTMNQTFTDLRDIIDSLATLGAGTITNPRTNHKRWNANQIQNYNGSSWDNLYPIADWSSLVNKPAFSTNYLLFGDGTSTPATSANVSYNGTTFTVLGSATGNTFKVGATGGGDCLLASGNTAGNGSIVASLNDAMSDYEPFQIIADDFFVNLRTGVGTSTSFAKFSNNVASWATNAAGLEIYGPTNWALLRLAGASGADLYLASSTASASVYATANVPMIFVTNSAEQMRLTTTGLGIGSSTVSAKVHSSVADGNYSLALSGTTKGLRVEHSSTETTIAGVDNTLYASYQKLNITGSELMFSVGGTQHLWLSSVGNLGIGESPLARLHVVKSGDSGTYANTTGAGFGLMHSSGGSDATLALAFRNTGVATGGIDGHTYASQVLANSTNANTLEIYTQGTIPLIFGTNSLARMTINGSTGNVGIGTTVPDTYLSGAAGMAIRTANPALSLSSSATSKTFILYGSSSSLKVYDPSVPADIAEFNSNGKLLVGVGGGTALARIDARDSADPQMATSYNDSNYTTFHSGSTGLLTVSTFGSGPGYIFNVSGSPCLSLSSKTLFVPDGTVSVGAWDTSTAKIQVSAANLNAQSNYLNIGHNYYYTSTEYRYLTTNFASVYSQVDGEHRFQSAASGTATNTITWNTGMRLLANGFLGLNVVTPAHPVVVGTDSANGNGAYCSATGNWTNGSDLSKKTDVFDLSVGLNEILQLQPKTFRYLNNPELQYGLIAQEVREVVPALVEGQEPNLALRTNQLIFPIINAIKQLAGRISALESA